MRDQVLYMKSIILNLHFVLTALLSLVLIPFYVLADFSNFVGTIVFVAFLGNQLFELMNPETPFKNVLAGLYGSLVVVVIFYIVYGLSVIF